MEPAYDKPLPSIGIENAAFWEGCRRGILRMQQCGNCGHIRYPISVLCPQCLSEDADWVALSGQGEVYAHIVFHRAYHPAFAEDLPYNVALVKLDEGPRMFSNIVGDTEGGIHVGDRVSVVFDPVTDEISIPRFQLAPS